MASSDVLLCPSESDIQAQWREALYEEDCLRVMKLLRENPNLLKQGWNCEPWRMVEGSRHNHWQPSTKSPWKGRTVLHVGARRGCTELLKQAIKLARDGLPAKPEKPSGGSIGAKDVRISHTHLPTALVELDEPVGTERKRKGMQPDTSNFFTSPVDLRQTEVPAWTLAGKMRTRLSKLVQQSVVVAKQEMDGGADLQINATAELSISSPGDGFSQDDLVALLRARDGEYQMDALAMTAVSGNVDAMNVLLEASVRTAANPYGVSVLPNPTPLADPEIHNRYRCQLRSITDKVIAKFSKDQFFDRVVLDSYRGHRDFNFLPREEYLFHFMFTDCFHRAEDGMAQDYSWEQTEVELLGILTDFWIEICQLWPSPWVFLLELQDGQGRAPFHVAVDENTCQRFFNTLRAIEQEPAEMLVSGPLLGANAKDNLTRANLRQNLHKIANCALQTRDGGGRTVIHRAVTLGRREALLHILRGTDEFDIDGENWSSDEASAQYSIMSALMSRSKFRFDMDALSKRNGFHGLKGPEWIEGKSNMNYSTPLHSAIIHKRRDVLELLLPELERCEQRYVDLLFPLFVRYRGEEIKLLLEPLQLSVLVGDASVVKRLVQWHQSRPLIPLSKGGPMDMAQREHVGRLLRSCYQKVQCLMDVFPPIMLGRRIFKLVAGLFLQLILALVAPGLRVEELGAQLLHCLESCVVCTRVLTIIPAAMSPERWPALHLAAASGRVDLLRLFLNTDCFDPFVEDCDGSSALHQATNGSEFEFYTHLLDYVDCAQILASQEERRRDFEERQGLRFLEEKSFVVQRQSCVNLLLHTGCDIFKTNKARQPPNPSQDSDAEFILWWNKKRANEFGVAFNKMNIAANAILVTAALVATASYVGPLQPPLGIDDNLMQLEFVWVRIFIVCDTMSFYLAVVTVICTLIISFPMPEVSLTQQMRRTEFLVAEAVQFLSFSIVFVTLAFASSSIAVVRTASGRPTQWTAIVGGGLCAIFIIWFFWQSFVFSFRRNGWSRTLFEVIIERIESSVTRPVRRWKGREGEAAESEANAIS